MLITKNKLHSIILENIPQIMTRIFEEEGRKMNSLKRRLCITVLVMFALITVVMSNLSSEVEAAPPNTVQMLRMRVNDFTYDNDAPGLPTVFANHDEIINLFFTHDTPGSTATSTPPTAVYCIEPSNGHIYDSGDYEFDVEPLHITLTDKQKGLLSYVLTEGQQVYYGPDKPTPYDESFYYFSLVDPSFSTAETEGLKLQIATQLAAWIIGANIYEKNDPYRHAMIGDGVTVTSMFAPNEEIAKMARDLLDAAIDAWESTPFDLDGDVYQMIYNETTDLYELSLTSHVFNTTSLTTIGQWGYELVEKLEAAGITVTIDFATIDTTNTIFLTHPNTTLTSLTLNVQIDDNLKSPVYYITYERPSSPGEYGQQMILIDKTKIKMDSSISLTMNNRLLPAIGTTAKDKADNDKILAPHEKVTIIDTVAYRNLDITKTYTLEGTIYVNDGLGGTPLLVGGVPVTATHTFTPQAPNGSVDLEFEFDARLLAGQTLVVFETLKESGITVTTHNDITDLGQTVTVSWIFQTTATDKADNDKVMAPLEKVTLVDKVEYRNLDITKEYELVGTVYDKSTGLPLVINGVVVTKTKKFTPTTPNGTEVIEFEFDARSLDGKVLVVFEKLFLNSVEIASHEDINDLGQSISIRKTPPPPTGVTTTTYASAATLLLGSAIVIYMMKKKKDDDE